MQKTARRKQHTHSVEGFVRILHAHLPELAERFSVKSLGVFGSYVRAEQKPHSDLDVLVEFSDDTLSLLKFIELEYYLSDLLGVKVDLVEKNGLKPAIGQRVLLELRPV